MVKVICGLIGSGKTTYAITNKKDNDILLDWDLLVEALKTDNPIWVKEIQDILLKYFYDKNYDIWYITTSLGSNEKKILSEMQNVEYIWINTTKEQCVKNIIKRNRNNEATYIKELDKANKNILDKYVYDKEIHYTIVNVFENNERW